MSLQRLTPAVIAIALAFGLATAQAEELQPLPLHEIVERYERNEKELAQLQEELKAARVTQEVRRLKERKEALEAQQAELAEAVERMIGPLPPEVGPEQRILLEQRARQEQSRHDAILEKDVRQRLPQQ